MVEIHFLDWHVFGMFWYALSDTFLEVICGNYQRNFQKEEEMRKKTIGFFVLVFLGLVATVHAVPITGEIRFSNFSPEDTFLVDQNGVNTSILTDATGVNFPAIPNAAVVGTATGDFASVPFGTSANFYDFYFANNNVTDPFVPTLLWDLTSGVNLYKFTITTVDSISIVGTTLTLIGRGDADINITGKDTTAGDWRLTLDGVNGRFTWSSDVAIPEASTVLLLGVGFISLAVSCRRLKG